MLDIVLIIRVLIIVFTFILLSGAIMKKEKGIFDWQVIFYLVTIIAYIIAR